MAGSFSNKVSKHLKAGGGSDGFCFQHNERKEQELNFLEKPLWISYHAQGSAAVTPTSFLRDMSNYLSFPWGSLNLGEVDSAVYQNACTNPSLQGLWEDQAS